MCSLFITIANPDPMAQYDAMAQYDEYIRGGPRVVDEETVTSFEFVILGGVVTVRHQIARGDISRSVHAARIAEYLEPRIKEAHRLLMIRQDIQVTGIAKRRSFRIEHLLVTITLTCQQHDDIKYWRAIKQAVRESIKNSLD